jgi:hypothetical protein
MRVSAKTWLPLLGAGLAALCLAGPARAVDADKLTPADAEVVISVNVRQLLDSPVFQKYGKDEAKNALQDPNAKKILGAVGLDPLKDVDSVLLTSAGDIADKPKVLVVARGKFDVSKIDAAAAQYAKDNTDLKITKEDGLTIYEGKGGDAKQTLYTHFVSDGKTLLASTDKAYLLQAIKTPPAAPSPAMQSALSKISGKDSIWLAMVVTDEMNKQLAVNPQTKDLAGKLEAVTGSINVTNDIQTNLVIHTADAMSAGDLKKKLAQVKPLLSLLAAGTNEDAAPILQDLVDNLKITTDQNSVKVSLKVSEDLLDKVNKQEKPEKPEKPEKKDK